MINKPDCYKRFNSALQRYLKPAIKKCLEENISRLCSGILQERLADELISLFDSICPEISRLKPGQLIWLALDKNTRATSPNKKFVPVILTIVSENDIKQLTNGVSHREIIKEAKARMYREAYAQGGIMSSRDIALVSLTSSERISQWRINYEKENNTVLPHTGALHDMGSTITHKNAILRKIIIEKKDPAQAARETCHSQKAVDHYLKDYYRVKTLWIENKDLDFIHHVTGLAKNVVKQYLEIINNEK